jgi:large subunit ribosomal protein L30
MAETIKVTLVKSGIGKNKKIRQTLRGLGLTKLNKTVELKNTQAIRGMIQKVSFLLRIGWGFMGIWRWKFMSFRPLMVPERQGRGLEGDRAQDMGRHPVEGIKGRRHVLEEVRALDSRGGRCLCKGVCPSVALRTYSRNVTTLST